MMSKVGTGQVLICGCVLSYMQATSENCVVVTIPCLCAFAHCVWHQDSYWVGAPLVTSLNDLVCVCNLVLQREHSFNCCVTSFVASTSAAALKVR